MPNIHPLLVHFPIALLTISVLFDLVYLLTKKEVFSSVGWWTQLAGVAGLAGTIVSGLYAERTVIIATEARSCFETHQQMAFVSATIFAILLLWRIASKTNLPSKQRAAYLLLSLLGVIAMWVGAWYGGEMVYGLNVGIGLRAF